MRRIAVKFRQAACAGHRNRCALAQCLKRRDAKSLKYRRVQESLAVLHQRLVLCIGHITGIENIFRVLCGIRFLTAKGSQILAPCHDKGLVGVAGGHFPNPAEIFMPGQTAQRIVVFLFGQTGHLVKDALVRFDTLHVFPAVVGQADFIERNVEFVMNQLTLVLADGIDPLRKMFGGKAVEPEFEAEKSAVGIHHQRADIVKYDHAAVGHQHIAGKAHIKRMVPAQVAGQHKQVIAVFDCLKGNHADIFERRDLKRAPVIPIAKPNIQAGALKQLIQPGDYLINIAWNAGDGVTQDGSVDNNGIQRLFSFPLWEQSYSSCCQSS